MTGASTSRRAMILSTGSFLPTPILSNEEIIARYGHGVAATAVRKVYGVERRHVAEQGTADSDLLAKAAALALTRAGRRPEDLSKLIVTKFLGDRLLPMTASLTQKKLGSRVAIQAFDVDGGTNAFLQAVEVGTAAIAMGDELVLVASGGIHNRLLSREDPRQAFLYGDGAAAVLLGVAATDRGGARIEATYQCTNSASIDFARGFEMRKQFASDMQSRDSARLTSLYEGGDWRSIEARVVDMVVQVSREVLARAGMRLDDMDLVLLTENHPRVWRAALDRLGVSGGKTVSMLRDCGNTMSAMLPLLLDHSVMNGRLARGQRVLLLSVGEGLNCGGLVATY